MKIILLCAMVLAMFSCSSNQKVAETQVLDRSVASQELDLILTYFKPREIIFNAEALKIRKSYDEKIKNLESNPTAKACLADNRLYRALSNSCTEALALCKKTEMSAVPELYVQYIKHIYSLGLGIEKELDEALAKGEKNIFYTNSKNIAALLNTKMKTGSDAVVAYYYSGKKLGIFDEILGSHKNTTDNKDDYETCALGLKNEIKAFDEAKVDFDKLIPR